MSLKTETPFGVYEPQPRNFNHINLPGRLMQIAIKLARQQHDVWAAKRLEDGLIYGSTRDEKHHPQLVDFNHLSDSEQQIDLDNAVTSVCMIVDSGYEIILKSELEELRKKAGM